MLALTSESISCKKRRACLAKSRSKEVIKPSFLVITFSCKSVFNMLTITYSTHIRAVDDENQDSDGQ